MIWQDIVVSIGSIGFAIANMFALRSKSKPPAKMSFMTAALLVGFVSVNISYGLWYGAACQTVNVIQWAIIGWQKTKQNRVHKRTAKTRKFWAI